MKHQSLPSLEDALVTSIGKQAEQSLASTTLYSGTNTAHRMVADVASYASLETLVFLLEHEREIQNSLPYPTNEHWIYAQAYIRVLDGYLAQIKRVAR